jgi:hypothetical protein
VILHLDRMILHLPIIAAGPARLFGPEQGQSLSIALRNASRKTSHPLTIVGELLQDVPGEVFVHFPMPGHWLGCSSLGVAIPIVFPTVANQ